MQEDLTAFEKQRAPRGRGRRERCPLPRPGAGADQGVHELGDRPMTTDHLTAVLRACAAGFYPLEAGVGLLISHGTFLHRDDFTSRLIEHGTSISDGTTTMAAIDWNAAITALRADELPCSGGERRAGRGGAGARAPQPRVEAHCDSRGHPGPVDCLPQATAKAAKPDGSPRAARTVRHHDGRSTRVTTQPPTRAKRLHEPQSA